MKITRTSPITNIDRTLDLDITDAQWDDWQSGTLIQEAMPHLTADEREFLISGIGPGEWEDMFGTSSTVAGAFSRKVAIKKVAESEDKKNV